MPLLLPAAGTLDEAFCPPLHFVQQGEVSLGAAHPCEGTVFHDGPHLGLVEPQEAICVEEVLDPPQQCHPQGGLPCHTLQMTSEAELGVNLHPQDADGVL